MSTRKLTTPSPAAMDAAFREEELAELREELAAALACVAAADTVPDCCDYHVDYRAARAARLKAKVWKGWEAEMKRKDAARVLPLKPGVRVPSAGCPHCGAAQDAASGLATHYPEPNDVSVCIQCAGVSVYDANLQRVAWPTNEPQPPEVLEVVRAIRSLRP